MRRLCILMTALLLWMMMTAACIAQEGGNVMIPDMSHILQFKVPQNEAMAFVQDMRIGWNLGNTFDATHDSYTGDEMNIESLWCGVKTTKEMIQAVKAAGFNTLRLPVSWHNHVSGEDFVISKRWLDRVQEVVDWAIDCDMYVILNIHHDNEKGFMYPSDEHQETSERYVHAIWTQLSERFAAYDEHLIFESLNEPRLKGTDIEWWFSGKEPRGVAAAECINRLNQVFVDTVRASGGNNAQRYLMVPGYCAAPAFEAASYFRVPEDTADNRIIISAHAYTPYSFALEMPGTRSFSAISASQTREIANFMNDLYKKFVANGIPVVIGEFGAMEKDGNLQDRVEFAAYYVAAASARGFACCWWDNNIFSGSGERFGLFDRKNLSWPAPELVEALMKYAGFDRITPRE
ncbi:MAG: glycoside hydrolase family 5 protein [Clostridia bacterium]|nr:glycoside hydrolase family 5 protein [Clostridia bacterium]